MQVFAYKMCNFLKKVFQCPPEMSDFSVLTLAISYWLLAIGFFFANS